MLYKSTIFALVSSAVILVPGAATATPQDAAAPAPKADAFNKLLGEVTAIDSPAKQITIKTDAGTPATVLLDEKTLYLRVPPGEKDLKKATKITVSDVGVGDRIYARSRKSADSTPAPATSVMIMSKSELVQHYEKTQAEWQTRGVIGTIKAIDPAAKTVVLALRGAEKADILVDSSDKANYRRYAPDSVRFADAKPSTFAALKIGDTMRVLGNKSDDGAHITPEEIISGSFNHIAATIISVDVAANQVKATNLLNKKPITITVNSDTTLKRLPLQMAGFMARMQAGGAPGSGNGPVGPGSWQGNRPGAGGAPLAPPSAAAPPPSGSVIIPDAGPSAHGPRMGPGSPGSRRPDINQILARVPAIALSDLKPGDAIMVASGAGANPNEMTAITLLAGVEPLLTAAPNGGQQPVGGAWNFEMAAPQ